MKAFEYTQMANILLNYEEISALGNWKNQKENLRKYFEDIEIWARLIRA